jgi:hypothetical protein
MEKITIDMDERRKSNETTANTRYRFQSRVK